MLAELRDEDRVLGIDWTELHFTQIVYELGETRIVFAALTDDDRANARARLAMPLPPELHPSCELEGMIIPHCLPPPPPPPDPRNHRGWVYCPRMTACWGAYAGARGAADCRSGAATSARVWVR